MINLDEKTKQIALKLRKIRELKGLTREQFCDPLCENADYWGLIERGEQAISLSKLLNVCEYYDIPIESVVDLKHRIEDNEPVKKEMNRLLDECNNRQIEMARKILEVVMIG